MQAALPVKLSVSRPEKAFHQTRSGKIVLAVGATALVAISARVSLPLPFTPVPLTLQNFTVLLVGMFLGPVAGFSSMMLYLAEGAVGLPVFSPHEPGGLVHLLGPNGGYLFSFPLVAAIAGLTRKVAGTGISRFGAAIVTGIAATAVIFLLGAGWLAHLLHLSGAAAWHMGIEPFLFGEAIKVTAAASMYSSARRWLRS